MAALGALYELVARGVKDTYISATAEKSGTYTNPYSQQTPPTQPIIHETRLSQAKSLKPIEFDIDIFGDIIESLRFKITLPSWLPSELPVSTNTTAPATTVEKLCTITDAANGASYSWTPYVAYYLFKNISVYQDNQIIYQIDGDGLYALSSQTGPITQSWLKDRTTGADATGQRELWVDLPFPGTFSAGGKGFPICAIYGGQTFRIRCELRSVDDLIVATAADGTVTKTGPWGRQLQYTVPSSQTTHTIKAVERTDLQSIRVELENIQSYLDNDARDYYAQQPHTIIYKSPFKNTWQITAEDYAPMARGAPEAVISRQIDGRHPTQEIIIVTRSEANIQNGLYIPVAPQAGYYNTVRLVIAGQEREAAWSETVLRDVENLIHMDTARSEADAGIIRYCWQAARGSQTGTVNFTTATKPIIQFSLANAPAQYIPAIHDIYVVGWAVYEIKNGRGRLAFYN